MSSISSKEIPMNAYPRTLLSIVAYSGGLAIFLIIASTILVQQPFGSTVHGYFYTVDSSRNFHSDSPTFTVSESLYNNTTKDTGQLNLTVSNGYRDEDAIHSSKVSESIEGEKQLFKPPDEMDSGQKEPSIPENTHRNSVDETDDAIFSPSVIASTKGCDLYQGEWIFDPIGPLYTNNSCPIITQMQNCQGNGRPDKNYENWRWKPSHCDLPRFDPKKFLELMRGKTLAFIGDSVARNQMESMLCILWQVEVPKNRGNRRMQRYYFRSTSTMIVRIWSSWLVHQTSEPFDFAPAGVVKIHLDLADKSFMDYVPGFDVVVLSSGHWFAKQSVYILDNKIMGGQLWWPDSSREKKIDNIEAFGISVETILTALGSHPNYTGLTIVRSFSPDHYEGGAWNTGGSCTGKDRPALKNELVENGFTNTMYEKQMTGFNRASKKKTNKSKIKFMDITHAFQYRHDGHPGPYRSTDPNKITKRGPDGRPPPQDCLHWCMPCPVDTWNELVLETITREFENREDGSG